MSRASKIIEASANNAAQKAADALLALISQSVESDDVSIEVVFDGSTAFLELEANGESITLAAQVTDGTPMLYVVSKDDDSIAIDLSALKPKFTDVDGIEVIDFSNTSWITQRLVDTILKAGSLSVEEAVALTKGGNVSSLIVVHTLSKNDPALIDLRTRADALGLDAYVDAEADGDDEGDDLDILAGTKEYGLFRVNQE